MKRECRDVCEGARPGGPTLSVAPSLRQQGPSGAVGRAAVCGVSRRFEHFVESDKVDSPRVRINRICKIESLKCHGDRFCNRITSARGMQSCPVVFVGHVTDNDVDRGRRVLVQGLPGACVRAAVLERSAGQDFALDQLSQTAADR